MSHLRFRNFVDENDYPLLVELNQSSRDADHVFEKVTLKGMTETLTHMDGLTPQEGVIITSLDETPIGYSRLGWYSSNPRNRLYYQMSFLKQEYRDQKLWPLMVAINEQRLRKIAAGHEPKPERFFQAWASDHNKDWAAVLAECGYNVVRRFNNMIYPLGEPPIKPVPNGIEIRTGKLENMRQVWQVLKEFHAPLFENVEEDWLDEKYPAWLEKPENDPQNWQIAWAGEQLAGLMCAHFDEKENENLQNKHGYTEHIYVKPVWRGLGLASALIARSLQVLKEQGITEAELGVDSENESAAFRLYEKLGYKTYSVDTWYRKPMD